MNVDIRDARAMRAIQPMDAAMYLRSMGWKQREVIPGRSSTWVCTVNDEEFEILLSLDQEIGDYALRMGDLLHVLSSAESRSEWETYADLLTTTSDVLRIRIAGPGSADGTLPIDEHAQIAQRARDLVLAAACAATDHRPVWHTRKPERAMEHVRKVRIGQSERGSYIITVVSRVPPLLHTDPELALETDPPFERQVMRTLADALRAMDRAAEQAALTAQFAAFDQSVSQGVNANLCDAVAAIWGEDQEQRTLEFGFTWSPARPIGLPAPRRIVLSADRIPVIREAARVMRERAPVQEFELRGPVVKLERLEGTADGKVSIVGILDGRQIRVVMELADGPYHLAVQAHDQGKAISCVGTLVREGRAFFLRNATEVAIAEE